MRELLPVMLAAIACPQLATADPVEYRLTDPALEVAVSYTHLRAHETDS